MTASTSVASNPLAMPGRSVADRAPAWLRLGFTAAGLVAPRAIASLIAKRMFQPRRRRITNADFGSVKPEIGRLAFDGRELTTYAWHGDGPKVLLVHGWEGATSDYSSLVPALNQVGYRIIAFDAPAHGASSGRDTDVHDIARSIRQVISHFGPVSAIVAHSIGAAASAVYLSELAGSSRPERLVLLAPGGDLESELERIIEALGLPERAAAALKALVEKRYGRPAAECSTKKALSGVRLPIFVIHDELDRVVPVSESEKIASPATGARLLRTRGLGHRKLLRDASLIQAIVDFLR